MRSVAGTGCPWVNMGPAINNDHKLWFALRDGNVVSFDTDAKVGAKEYNF